MLRAAVLGRRIRTDRARRTIRQPGHIRCRAERLQGMGLRPEALLSTQIQSICRRRHSAGGSQSQTGTANAAQADRPRPDRHKIAAGFAAPAGCIQTGAENVHARAAGDRKNSAVSRCGSRNERKSTGGIDLRCFFAFTLCPQFPPQRLYGPMRSSTLHSQRQKQPRMQCIRGCLIYASSGSGRSTMIASWWTAGRILSSTSCVAMASVDELMHGWQPIMRDSAMGLSMTS